VTRGRSAGHLFLFLYLSIRITEASSYFIGWNWVTGCGSDCSLPLLLLAFSLPAFCCLPIQLVIATWVSLSQWSRSVVWSTHNAVWSFEAAQWNGREVS
jgi:hypothetical protein